MSSDQPYNALGQILAEGGEIAVGLSIIQEPTDSGWLLLIGRRFGFLGEQEKEALVGLAQQMVLAGAAVHQLPPGSQIGPNQIPLNQYLFGGDLQGRRVLITGEVEIPGAEHRVQLRIPFTDIPTIDEIRQAFLDRGLEIAGNYPGKFGLPVDTPIQGGQVYVLLPERAF